VAALAQGSQTGILRGTAVDEQGLPVASVGVSIKSAQLQGQRSTLTGTDGTFVFRDLPAGNYEVRYEKGGFARATQSSTIPLGGVAEHLVTLRPEGVTESLRVVAETPTAIATPAVGLNIRQDEVEALPASRTLSGIASLSPGLNEIAPNANVGQLTISGAFAYDNIFMLNGVDVNDNVLGAPQNLFIEDAISETQVLTSGINAEYGRFSGGVINAITRSGGNRFDGSYRINLTNPAWANETPFERDNGTERPSDLNLTHEATFGGPLSKDRLWFFAAGRLARTSTAGTFDETAVSYVQKDDNRRGEIKSTGTFLDRHTVQAGYLNNYQEQVDRPSVPGISIDPFVLDDRQLKNWYAFANWRGILGSRFLAEAKYSQRKYGFEDSGGSDTDIVNSPIRTLDLGLLYNAPYFDATDPEQRNNRQFTATMTGFVGGQGRHEIKAGYEFFRSQLVGGNSQSATGFVLGADYAADAAGAPLVDADGHLIPVFVPGVTFNLHWLPVRGATLNVDNQSFYVQDHWAISQRWTADVGLRYERVRSEATGGLVGVDTDTIVPRLATSFDPAGDGGLVFHATYGHYAGRYIEPQINANSNVGNPDLLVGVYRGPFGSGRAFAPGFDPANYRTVTGDLPSSNVFFEHAMSSPLTREFTLSAGSGIGTRGHGELSYVWRNMSNFIEDFIDTTNGFTTVAREGFTVGTFTNRVFRNTDLSDRQYQALVLQGRFNPTRQWTLNGFWTVQLKNEGNFVGEAESQPGLPSVIGDYPEIYAEARHYPTGRLPSFQRHRVRLWAIYNLGLGSLGDMSVAALARVESGQVFSFVARAPLSEVQAALLSDRYPDAPANQAIYFHGRGTETFPGYGLLDLSVNYSIPIWRELRPWLKFDVFNVFNSDKMIQYDTTVDADEESPRDELGIPTGFVRGSRFGQATSTSHFVPSLGGGAGIAFRMALGLRF
jgi:outer membrane receptor protein involved in Fe transport